MFQQHYIVTCTWQNCSLWARSYHTVLSRSFDAQCSCLHSSVF